MKVNIEFDMTPDEARRLMGLPDVTALQTKMTAEIERRMKAALDNTNPEAMLKAWFPAEGFEQFQRFLWDAARTGAKKDSPKR